MSPAEYDRKECVFLVMFHSDLSFITDYMLHADLLRHKSARFVEFHRPGIAAPDVQRYIITAQLPRKVKHSVIQRSADVSAALIFVNADIVYIQRLYIGKDIVSRMLLEDAEGVAEDIVIFVRRDQYRAGIVVDYFNKLLIGVFPPAVFEKVGSAEVMHEAHLTQQLVYCRYIPDLGVSYIHFIFPFGISISSCHESVYTINPHL